MKYLGFELNDDEKSGWLTLIAYGGGALFGVAVWTAVIWLALGR
jgi:hypothetical protein